MKKAERHALSAARYAFKRKRALDLLGGKCVVCGTTERLEIDHRIPEDKEFEVSKALQDELTDEMRAELAKCQVLCQRCHLKKTLKDRGQMPARGTHGTLSSWRYCSCDLCRKVHTDYCTEWHRKAKINRKRRERRREKKK